MIDIRVVGTGTPDFERLYRNAEQAASGVGMDTTVQKVQKPNEVAEYGPMSLPALVIDGVVRTKGTVPTAADIKEMIYEAAK